MYSKFLLEEIQSKVSNKIRKLAEKDPKGLERYKETLQAKGVSLVYTLATRSEDSTAGAEDIETAALYGITRLLDKSLNTYDVFDTPDSLQELVTREVVIKTKGTSEGLKFAGGRKVTSLLSLGKVLNMLVSLKAEEIMKNEPDTLRFRTGRLANSGFVSRLNKNKDSSVSIWFSYMQFPYDTFRPDIGNHPNKSARHYRDPRWLFSRALALAIQEALSINSYKTTIFKLRFGNSIAAEINRGNLTRKLM